MKIAIPTKENMVDDHFGHCEYYTVLTIGQDNQFFSADRGQSAPTFPTAPSSSTTPKSRSLHPSRPTFPLTNVTRIRSL